MKKDDGVAKEIDKVITDMKNNIIEMENVLDSAKNCMTNTPYIIVCDKVAVSPEIINGKTTGKISNGLPHTVKRFSKKNAEHLAKLVKNGVGTVGKAVAWKEFTKQSIESYKETIWNVFGEVV